MLNTADRSESSVICAVSRRTRSTTILRGEWLTRARLELRSELGLLLELAVPRLRRSVDVGAADCVC